MNCVQAAGSVTESARAPARVRCRFCDAPLEVTVCDLGAQPLANSYLRPEQLQRPEPFLALETLLCTECWLVQLPTMEQADAIFAEYAYFSSFSTSWLEHAKQYVDDMVARFGLDAESLVVEVASNDGYLLRSVKERGVPCFGIEPARNIALHAEAQGIPTINRFLGAEVGAAVADGSIDVGLDVFGKPFESSAAGLVGRGADLVVANNVFAHVPDLNGFTRGLRALLAPTGVLTIEVQHLLTLLDQVQFDTIYHEHFQYYSLHAAQTVLAGHGLEVFDVELLPTHGGSLRVFGRRTDAPAEAVVGPLTRTPRVDEVLQAEREAGLLDASTYADFEERVRGVKRGLLRFLFDASERGETVVAYGAPAKGNTLLNYCGIEPGLVRFTVDRNPHKQGCFLPGSRLPIRAPEAIDETKPDWVLILPWNLEREIVEQMKHVREWGGRFVVAVPEVREV